MTYRGANQYTGAIPASTRFWAYVDKSGECWLWLGALSYNGYGSFYSGGTCRTHRFAWEEVNGRVPIGMCLDHLCRNRRCVRPDHLEPVTIAENVRRSPRCTIGIGKAREIRAEYAKGQIGYRTIAKLFGLSRDATRMIILEKIYRETNHPENEVGEP